MNTLYVLNRTAGHAPTCPTPATWPPPWLADQAGERPAVALPPAPVASSPQAPPVAVVPVGDGWESAIEPPPPCPKCGSLELWQDILGGWHCQHCDGAKFQRSLRLMDQAARLQRVARPVVVGRVGGKGKARPVAVGNAQAIERGDGQP